MTSRRLVLVELTGLWLHSRVERISNTLYSSPIVLRATGPPLLRAAYLTFFPRKPLGSLLPLPYSSSFAMHASLDYDYFHAFC
jgi:hypothetical protein